MSRHPSVDLSRRVSKERIGVSGGRNASELTWAEDGGRVGRVGQGGGVESLPSLRADSPSLWLTHRRLDFLLSFNSKRTQAAPEESIN